VQAALGRLDGVQLAKLGTSKSLFELKVAEGRIPLPAQIAKAIPKPFAFRAVNVTGLPGEIRKSGEDFILTVRGSDRKFTLQVDDEIRKRLKDGLSIQVSGKIEESPSKDAPPPLPAIRVTEVREIPGKSGA